MELTGKIIAVMEAKSGKSAKTGNPWMVQEYVIEVPGQYPRSCVFTVFGEDVRAYNVIRGQIPQSPIIGIENETTPFPPFPVSDGKDPGDMPF